MPLDPGLAAELAKRGLSDRAAPETQGPPTRSGGLWDEIKRRGLEVPKPEQSSAPPSIWENIKNYGKESLGALGEGAAAIPGEAGRLAGNLAKGLMLTEAGAQAGGEAVRQLGDIGSFASGGLTSPIQTPTQAAGIARGLDVQPRVAQVARPQLALPPPQVTAAGRPPISTGQGMIPPGAPARMTAPSATPVQAPGMAAKPAAPLVPPGAEIGQPSRFASALASNDSLPIDRALTSRYRRAVGAGPPGVRSERGLTQQDMRITTAVDSIIDGKDAIQFRNPSDPTGNSMLPAGRLPRNLSEFSQAIDQQKSQLFDAYDDMATRMTGQGARVPLAPVINRLQQFIAGPEVRDIEPAVANAATKQIERFAQSGSYSPKEAQNVISSLNASLEREIRNPTNAVSHNAMNGEILSTLRDTLNKTMEQAFQAPQYQALRQRFGALSSIEADVANAVRKQLGQGPGFFEKLTNLGTWAGAAHGMLFHDLRSVAVGAGVKGAQQLYQYMHSPNRAVSQLFSRRAAEMQPSMLDRASAGIGTQLGSMRQGIYDRGFANRPPQRDPYVSPAGS